MNTRMDKYYKEDNLLEESRTAKNKDIYNKVKEEDFENLELTSNISIIDADTTNLDIEKLKSLLEEKYSKPKRSAVVEEIEIQDEKDLEDTKEYDLKKVIDEAHKNKSSDYDKERFKRLRDTQYDILNSLNLERTGEPLIEESLTVEEANLMNLIKTINENPTKKDTVASTNEDLLGDLKGENTEVLEPMDFDEDAVSENEKKPTLVEELEKTKQLYKKDFISEIAKEETTEHYDEDIEEDEKTIDSSEIKEEFYTGKFQIEESDLDEFSDLQKEISSGNGLIKVLVVLLILIIIVIGVFLLNKYLNLGLF